VCIHKFFSNLLLLYKRAFVARQSLIATRILSSLTGLLASNAFSPSAKALGYFHLTRLKRRAIPPPAPTIFPKAQSSGHFHVATDHFSQGSTADYF
jgi:hypothetical protein